MTAFTFTKAVKAQEKLRLALDGPTGSGKTWTALIIGTYLAKQTGGRMAVIDSERSSARKYAGHFDFDHLTLPDFSPHTYMGAVRAAEEAGYAVIIVDSFTHAWEGVLDLKDNVTARSRSKNSYTEGWREATPVHNQLVDTVLRADAHIIATLRTKTEYIIEDGGGVKKVGTKPIQRDGVEYEFDVVADMDQQNTLLVSKTRCPEINGKVIRKPDEAFAQTLWAWLTDGEKAISTADAERLAEVLNAKGQAARAAWLTKFGGVKPAALPESRLDEANAFVANLPEGDDDPPPPTDDGGPGGNGQGSGGSGGATDSDAVAGTPAGDTPPEPAIAGAGTDGGGTATPAAAGRNPEGQAPPPHGINVRDVARKAALVFKADHDAAPRGKKGLVVDRLRHALVFACTQETAASLNDLTPEQLANVWQRLEDIAAGRITYDGDPLNDAAGVTFTSSSGKETTVLWAESEMAANHETEAA